MIRRARSFVSSACCAVLQMGPQDWTPERTRRRAPTSREVTVHRLLQLLRSQGLVDVDPATRRYGAGAELYRFGAMLSARMPYTHIARPDSRRTSCGSCDETAVLGLYQPARAQMIFAATAESGKTDALRAARKTSRNRLLWGATGRAILAFLDPRGKSIARSRCTSRRRPALRRSIAPHSMWSYARFANGGTRFPRRPAHCVSRRNRRPRFSRQAVTFLGDIAITIPDFRFDDTAAERLTGLVVAGAERMSTALGFTGVVPGRANSRR